MKEITFSVPDENCEGCSFLMKRQTSYYANEGYSSYCRVFATMIYNNKKCLGCEILSTKKGE